MPEQTRPGAIDPSFSRRGHEYDADRPVVARRMVRGQPVSRPARSMTHEQPQEQAVVKVKNPDARKRHSQTHKPALPRHTRSTVLNRQFTVPKKNETLKEKAKKFSGLSRKSAWLMVAAFAFLGLSGWSMQAQDWRLIGGVKGDRITRDLTAASEDVATEDMPVTEKEINGYRVSPTLPRIIKVDKLQIKARIAHIPLTTDGKVKAPANIHDAGWLSASSKPGEAGVMVVSGHMHGSDNPGVFSRLGNLRQGDVITVERGDGKLFEYKVVKSVIYDNDRVDMDALMQPIKEGKPGLNLLSHTNRYDVSTGKYEQRLAVFASLK